MNAELDTFVDPVPLHYQPWFNSRKWLAKNNGAIASGDTRQLLPGNRFQVARYSVARRTVSLRPPLPGWCANNRGILGCPLAENKRCSGAALPAMIHSAKETAEMLSHSQGSYVTDKLPLPF